MTPPKKRKLLQLHLSTALALMLVTAGIMFLQTLPKYGDSGSEFLMRDWRSPSSQTMKIGTTTLYDTKLLDELVQSSLCQNVMCYGWPFEFGLRVDWELHQQLDSFHFYSIHGIIKNSLLTTLILLATAILCERRIRTSTSTKDPRT